MVSLDFFLDHGRGQKSGAHNPEPKKVRFLDLEKLPADQRLEVTKRSLNRPKQYKSRVAWPITITHSEALFWRGAETWGLHESPSYPHMYCFLAWRERMESSTEKILRWNTIVIGDFLNLGSVSHECRQYQFLRYDNVSKVCMNFFNEKVISKFYVNHVVLRESRSFSRITYFFTKKIKIPT